MSHYEYCLTGFDDDFLEQRRLVFVDAMPSTRVCSTCGVVPSQSKVLPCGHVCCEACKLHADKTRTCLLDGRSFVEGDVQTLEFNQRDLEEMCFRCINVNRNCDFVGKLGELKKHLSECVTDEVKCVKCGCCVIRRDALGHYRGCAGARYDVPTELITEQVPLCFFNDLANIKNGLKELVKRASSDDAGSKDTVVNDAKSLVEHVTSFEEKILRVKEQADSNYQSCSSRHWSRAGLAPGPYRSASKKGAFVALCKFEGVYSQLSQLQNGESCTPIQSQIFKLGGYACCLCCKSAKGDSGEMSVSFVLCLSSGVFDEYLDWPFTGKATVVLTHTRNEAEDIRLNTFLEDSNGIQKPKPKRWYKVCTSDKASWKDIELKGFIHKKSLYVHVELE